MSKPTENLVDWAADHPYQDGAASDAQKAVVRIDQAAAAAGLGHGDPLPFNWLNFLFKLIFGRLIWLETHAHNGTDLPKVDAFGELELGQGARFSEETVGSEQGLNFERPGGLTRFLADRLTARESVTAPRVQAGVVNAQDVEVTGVLDVQGGNLRVIGQPLTIGGIFDESVQAKNVAKYCGIVTFKRSDQSFTNVNIEGEFISQLVVTNTPGSVTLYMRFAQKTVSPSTPIVVQATMGLGSPKAVIYCDGETDGSSFAGVRLTFDTFGSGALPDELKFNLTAIYHAEVSP